MRHFRSGLLLSALVTLASLGSAEAHGEKVIYSFAGSDGARPSSDLIMDASGSLFGVTRFGGANNFGTVFKVSPRGKEKVLYSFAGGSDGGHPVGGLAMDSAGNLYGTTLDGGANDLGTVFKLTSHGKKKILHSFASDGDTYAPNSPLIMDADGNLYGTTTMGGVADNGTVYKVTPTGQETVLLSFMGGSEGFFPAGGLIMDASGNLYGTAQLGGANGVGAVFKLTPGGQETILYSFDYGNYGQQPAGGVIMDDSGNLYGTTLGGGEFDQGIVFKVTPEGQETILYAFDGGTGGGTPFAGLVMDASNNLYGTTYSGGHGGTVFKLTPSGKETVLHGFNAGADGAHPDRGVIMDARGNLYGTTPEGGAGSEGVVFKVKN